LREETPGTWDIKETEKKWREEDIGERAWESLSSISFSLPSLCVPYSGGPFSQIQLGGLGVMSYPSMSQDSWQSLDDKWFLVHSELKITLH